MIHTLYRTPNSQVVNPLSELLQNICFIVLEYVGLDVKIEYCTFVEPNINSDWGCQVFAINFVKMVRLRFDNIDSTWNTALTAHEFSHG